MKRDIIIDCETLATNTTPVLLSIGACTLDRDEAFLRHVTIDSQLPFRTIDPNTAVWWVQQSEAALASTFCPSYSGFIEPKADLAEVLGHLSTWIEMVAPTCEGGRNIWTNGAAADAVWLETAYAQLALKCPWSYRDVRCLRTLYALFPEIEPARTEYVSHSAVDDALYQARRAELCLLELPKYANTGALLRERDKTQ